MWEIQRENEKKSNNNLTLDNSMEDAIKWKQSRNNKKTYYKIYMWILFWRNHVLGRINIVIILWVLFLILFFVVARKGRKLRLRNEYEISIEI